MPTTTKTQAKQSKKRQHQKKKRVQPVKSGKSSRAGAKAGQVPVTLTKPAKRPKKKPTLEGHALALAIADAALDKKAIQVEIIDVRGKVDYADYVVVMSGRSHRQVVALSRAVEQRVVKEGGASCLGVEGVPHGNWVLMDFGDAVVHIFHDDMRGYYDLEALWIDAARVQVQGA